MVLGGRPPGRVGHRQGAFVFHHHDQPFHALVVLFCLLHRQPELLPFRRRQFAQDAALFGVRDQFVGGMPDARDDRLPASVNPGRVGAVLARGVV